MKNGLVWFRQDLRISDNPALCEALNNSDKIAAIYIHDEESKGVRKMGSASKWWLHYALEDLSKNLKDKDFQLSQDMKLINLMIIRRPCK